MMSIQVLHQVYCDWFMCKMMPLGEFYETWKVWSQGILSTFSKTYRSKKNDLWILNFIKKFKNIMFSSSKPSKYHIRLITCSLPFPTAKIDTHFSFLDKIIGKFKHNTLDKLWQLKRSISFFNKSAITKIVFGEWWFIIAPFTASQKNISIPYNPLSW